MGEAVELYKAAGEIVDRRAYLCDRVGAVENGSIPFRSALRGLNLSVVVETTWSDLWVQQDPETGAWSGFEHQLVQLLATKGGFSANMYHQAFNASLGWDAWLGAYLPYHDFTSTWFSLTLPRAEVGIFSPRGWLDTSTIGVMEHSTREVPMEERILTWTKPFSPLVWFSLIAAAIVTGLVYHLIEFGTVRQGGKVGDSSDIAGTPAACTVMPSILESSLTMTGVASFEPKTSGGKVIQLSWSFTVVILVAAYTANLATYLVIQETQTAGFESIAAGIAKGASLCVPKGGVTEALAYDLFPQLEKERVQFTQSSRTSFQHLVEGRCRIALSTKQMYELARRNASLNPNCALGIVGGPLSKSQGGFMVKADYTDKCTILVKHVLHMLFMELEEDGVVQEMYQREVVGKQATRTEVCDTSRSEAATTQSMYLENVAFVFIPHLIVAVLVAVGRLLLRAWKRRKAQGDASPPRSEPNAA